jgi:hypothetical protein
MGGGLMQLVAYGAQDIYLSGNPQITFFKVVYRRHTNFAVESIEQTHNGSAAPGSKISVTVSRNGDLLSQVWLVNKTGAAVTPEQAFKQIDNVEVEIGGQIIDKQYGHWMQVWTDLTNPSDKSALLDSCAGAANGENSYVPLQFWFCRNPGLALPLIALQYHEVKLNITFASSITNIGTVSVWCDYVFLDTDERRRFAQVSHEYLIEQVQYSNALSVEGSTTQKELRFNHPVKELVWTLHHGTNADGSYDVGAGTDIEVGTALLQLNGHDRFKRREGKYFTTVQRYQHHSGSSDAVHRAAVLTPGATVNNEESAAASGADTLHAIIDVADEDALKFTTATLVTIVGLTGSAIVSIGVGATATSLVSSATAGQFAGADAIALSTTTGEIELFTIGDVDIGATTKGSATALNIKMGSNAKIPASKVTITPAAVTADDSIPHVYSFALKPEEHQPSGTCNFSRIDNAVLNLEHATVEAPATLKVYAVNYNVLRIMSGMGGLAYSN